MIKKIQLFVEKNETIYKVFKLVYANTFGRYSMYKQNKLFKLNAKEVLYRIDNVFKELQMDYWLEFGTLLGAVREKDFIGHDIDIDIGMFLSDYNKEIEKVFFNHGFVRSRQISVDNGSYALEETYIMNGIGVDIFYFHQNNNNEIVCHEFTYQAGKSRPKTIQDLGGLIVVENKFPYFGLDAIDFVGKSFPIPKKPHEHLKAHYGESYMIPNSSWSPNVMAMNQKIIIDKIGIVQTYE